MATSRSVRKNQSQSGNLPLQTAFPGNVFSYYCIYCAVKHVTHWENINSKQCACCHHLHASAVPVAFCSFCLILCEPLCCFSSSVFCCWYQGFNFFFFMLKNTVVINISKVPFTHTSRFELVPQTQFPNMG